MNHKKLWLWLSLGLGAGNTEFNILLDGLGSIEKIYEADYDKYVDLGISERLAEKLSDKSLKYASEVYAYCVKYGVQMLCFDEPEFPASLKGLKTPPALLYCMGNLPDLNKNLCISVVGTRKMSEYGMRCAYKIAYEMAAAGAVVVSGMALGIDGVAACGAISGGGKTVAILGSGIDVCYPEEHLTLARETVKAGCIMTEYAPGTPPDRYNFPKRNRLISGLSAASLVIEGKEQSGAMITARHAMAQNRPVYALPGNVDSPGSAAAHLLLRSGAKLLTSADDVVRDLEDSYLGILNPFAMAASEAVEMEPVLRRLSLVGSAEKEKGKEKGFFASRIFKKNPPAKSEKEPQEEEFPLQVDERKSDALLSSMDPEARMVFDAIPKSGSCALESLCSDALPLRTVMKYLLKLEIKGLVTMLPGERVQRADHV